MKRLVFSLLVMAVGLSMTAKSLNSKPSTLNSPFAGYIFAYFEGGGDTKLMEQLRFAVSEDAQNWYALNGNRPVIASDSISESGGIRDPHILRGEDGCYYIVATDMHTFDPKQGWGANPGIVLLKSKDLVNWTHAKINEGLEQEFRRCLLGMGTTDHLRQKSEEVYDLLHTAT